MSPPRAAPTTLMDLGQDMWEEIARRLPPTSGNSGRLRPRDRFNLALTCKTLFAFLVDAPTGAAWNNITIVMGRDDEAKAAGLALAARTVCIVNKVHDHPRPAKDTSCACLRRRNMCTIFTWADLGWRTT